MFEILLTYLLTYGTPRPVSADFSSAPSAKVRNPLDLGVKLPKMSPQNDATDVFVLLRMSFKHQPVV